MRYVIRKKIFRIPPEDGRREVVPTVAVVSFLAAFAFGVRFAIAVSFRLS